MKTSSHHGWDSNTTKPELRMRCAHRSFIVQPVPNPTTMDDALDLAMQYGKDIVDGKIQATEL